MGNISGWAAPMLVFLQCTRAMKLQAVVHCSIDLLCVSGTYLQPGFQSTAALNTRVIKVTHKNKCRPCGSLKTTKD